MVSMGDLAASGGYYIAAPADVVFAEPSTMTGSIGDLRGSRSNAAPAGDIARHQRRDQPPRRPRRLPVALPAVDRGGAEDGHGQDALPLRPVPRHRARTAARSRGLTVGASVDELGRGQVWTGALAQSVGLVDKLGGLAAAIDEAVAPRPASPSAATSCRRSRCCRAPKAGLLRHLAGAADEVEARRAGRPCDRPRSSDARRSCAPPCACSRPRCSRRQRRPGAAPLRHRPALTRRAAPVV